MSHPGSVRAPAREYARRLSSSRRLRNEAAKFDANEIIEVEGEEEQGGGGRYLRPDKLHLLVHDRARPSFCFSLLFFVVRAITGILACLSPADKFRPIHVDLPFGP